MAAAAPLMRRAAIRVHVKPPPATFRERRAVLKTLQQYGKVLDFKAVPAHDSIFISLMDDADSADKLIRACPVNYNVEDAKQDLLQNPAPSVLRPEAINGSTVSIVEAATDELADTSSGALQDNTSQFSLSAYATEVKKLQAGSNGKLKRSWPEWIDGNNSFVTRTLKQSLPDDIARTGLAHWEPDYGKQETTRSKTNFWAPSKMLSQGRSKGGKSQSKSQSKS